jgi:triacylglycerol lipase
VTDPIRLKHPIVLVHGLGARKEYGPFDYFYGLRKRLLQAGNEVFQAKLTPFQSIEHRAAQLKEQIEAAQPEGKVNLIAHSMGGLDARFMASRLGYAERIASITTIGTSHRGSHLADWALSTAPTGSVPLVNWMLSFLGASLEGIRQCTTEYCQRTFYQLAPNMPGVGYFSAMSTIRSATPLHALPVFFLPYRILSRIEGDNDGLVSEESSKWGEHICTYRGDHYAQIGQILGHSRGLDYVKFYDEILKRLKREGM